jgi:hypothetical protein
MQLKSSALAIAVICSSLFLTSCLEISHVSGPNATVAIQPQIKSISANAVQTFTTVTRDAPNDPIWSVNGNSTSGLITPGGTFVSTSSNRQSAIYTAPAVPPIYSAAQVSAGAVQGSVTLTAGIPVGQYVYDQIVATETFVIIGPVSVGLSPSDVSVKVGNTEQFTAYVVGTINTALTWQVNSVAGGSMAFGSISPSGLYTAPTAIPMTGKSVTVTAVSQADPTESASSVVSLTAH